MISIVGGVGLQAGTLAEREAVRRVAHDLQVATDAKLQRTRAERDNLPKFVPTTDSDVRVAILAHEVTRPGTQTRRTTSVTTAVKVFYHSGTAQIAPASGTKFTTDAVLATRMPLQGLALEGRLPFLAAHVAPTSRNSLFIESEQRQLPIGCFMGSRFLEVSSLKPWAQP